MGGTGGDTADILRICRGRMAPGGRIVIGTILVETLAEVLGTIQDTDLDDLDITQVHRPQEPPHLHRHDDAGPQPGDHTICLGPRLDF